jgi:hypothetical protein
MHLHNKKKQQYKNIRRNLRGNNTHWHTTRIGKSGMSTKKEKGEKIYTFSTNQILILTSIPI